MPVPLGLTGTAAAAPPVSVTGQITDEADVLSSGDESEVQAALEELQAEDGTQLYVVYVDSFDGTEGSAWAQQTYERSGMGGDDVLLAVAVEDRRYGTWVSEESGLSESDDQQVRVDTHGEFG